MINLEGTTNQYVRDKKPKNPVFIVSKEYIRGFAAGEYTRQNGIRYYTQKESKDINKYLHQKEDYAEFDLSEYLSQFNLLLELSIYNFNLSIFTYYNLKAVLKILKKFDKKIIGAKNKKNHILFNYVQAKLEEQNSDMLYLFRFKMIDEVNAIMESLIQYLKDCLKNNKKKCRK